MDIKNSLITCFLMMMMIQCYSAQMSSLPAPVNTKVHSTNFHHVLTWDPGPGTPPGTQYIVLTKLVREKEWKRLPPTSSTSRKLELKKYLRTYELSVQASLNTSTSPNSKPVTFCPVIDTDIGPPMLSVAGCGTCITLNISMPKPDNYSTDFNDTQKLYAFKFRIYWKKDEQKKGPLTQDVTTSDTSYRLENLEAGVKYCIKVEPEITTNPHGLPSEWKCEYTSRLEPSRGPAVVYSLASTLVLGGGVLVVLFSCLYYTGFLCRLQYLPAAFSLMSPLIHRYFLTPERTIPDSVSIQSDPGQQMTAANHRPLRPNMGLEEENEEEEDEGGALYLQGGRGGAADLSSGEGYGVDSDSQNASGPGLPAAAAAISGGCGSWRGVAELAAEGMEPGGHGQISEGKGERPMLPDLVQTGILGHVGKATEEDEQTGGLNSSGHVNLFAVTLGSQEEEDNVNLFSVTLGAKEEDEEEYDEAQSAKDFLRPRDERPLLATDSPRRTSGDAGAQRETPYGDGTLRAGIAEAYPQSGYVDRHAGVTDTDPETEAYPQSGYVDRHAGVTDTDPETEAYPQSGYVDRHAGVTDTDPETEAYPQSGYVDRHAGVTDTDPETEAYPQSGYVDRHAGVTDTDPETEEEEEFSGYMGR